MLNISNVKKQFGGFYALDGVDLHVEKGSVYGLVGPNGAGKSTLLRCIMGIYRQDEGNILIENQPVYENADIKSKIAYIPDDIFYFLQSNVKDMMKFYKGLYPNFSLERFEKLKDVFETVNIKKPIRKMSKGMQKQVAFWLSICCNPDLLVLDEPVDGLDPVMRRQIWSILMQDVAERGTTVIVSSHNLRELEDVCDTVGIMNKGKVILERSLSELQDNITKLICAFPKGERPESIEGLNIMHESKQGSVYTFIVKDSPEAAKQKLSVYSPLFTDAIPLNLEEIFIYELGGVNYEVKEIIL